MTSIKLLDKDLPLKLEWLKSFLTVAELQGFTKAARALHLSQPAISTHVKELEENLGVRLFEHLGGRVRLSRSGEAAAREARKLLDGVRSFRDAVVETEQAVKGTLALGASTTPGNYLLPAVMGRFEKLYPEAKTTLSIGNSAQILDQLTANEVDLGLVGDVTGVYASAIQRWHVSGSDAIPVIAPIAMGEDGQMYNVNADTAAAEVATALQAHKLVLLTDVQGIMRDAADPGSLLSSLHVNDVEGLISQGVIKGGMIPKVKACVKALKHGVNKTHIIDGRVMHSLLLEVFTDQGIGTEIGQ